MRETTEIFFITNTTAKYDSASNSNVDKRLSLIDHINILNTYFVE